MAPPSYVNKLLQSISGKIKTNPVNVVAQRFLQVFLDHGVDAAQIPRLLLSVKLDDLKSEDALLSALTPEVLDQAAHLFGIRSQWLEGVDDEIYENRYCYKQPELFFEHFATLRHDVDDVLGFPVRAISTTKNLDYTDSREQMLALVLVEPMARLGDERICRYHVYGDGWDWSHTPARIQLKAIVRVVCKALHTPVPLFIVKPSEMEAILEGKLIPMKFMDGCQITNPSLEDFALTSKESGVAKEVDEIPEVLRYIEEHKLENLIPKKPAGEPENKQPIVATVNENAVKAANAKHARRNAIKAQFISFYQTEGSNHPSKKASAQHFFDSLNEKQEKLLFDNKDAAIRTLLDALRTHLKEANPSK